MIELAHGANEDGIETVGTLRNNAPQVQAARTTIKCRRPTISLSRALRTSETRCAPLVCEREQYKLASIVQNAYRASASRSTTRWIRSRPAYMSHCDHDAPGIQLIESAVFYDKDQETPESVPQPGLEGHRESLR